MVVTIKVLFKMLLMYENNYEYKKSKVNLRALKQGSINFKMFHEYVFWIFSHSNLGIIEKLITRNQLGYGLSESIPRIGKDKPISKIKRLHIILNYPIIDIWMSIQFDILTKEKIQKITVIS